MSAGDRVNFSGELEFTAPTGGVTAGKVYKINGAKVVARQTADAAATFLGGVVGVYECTKAVTTGVSFAVGDLVYFTSANICTNAATGNTYLGLATAPAAVAATKVNVSIDQSAS